MPFHYFIISVSNQLLWLNWSFNIFVVCGFIIIFLWWSIFTWNWSISCWFDDSVWLRNYIIYPWHLNFREDVMFLLSMSVLNQTFFRTILIKSRIKLNKWMWCSWKNPPITFIIIIGTPSKFFFTRHLIHRFSDVSLYNFHFVTVTILQIFWYVHSMDTNYIELSCNQCSFFCHF